MAARSGGRLEPGQAIPTIYGKSVVVKRLLGEGGQGRVYAVDYDGEEKALKWYYSNVFANRDLFKNNLRENIMSSRPASEFLWPLDMADASDGSFGYVMDLRPEGYYDATEYLLHNVHFVSYRRAVDACLNAISAFRQLHQQGMCYKDINGGNFFFNPRNGKTLICDIDNVGPSNVQTGIIGTPRFMAPEVVRRESLPNVHTDRYSMSVLIYMLLCMGHPLEGKRTTMLPVLDSAHQTALYGTDPIFVMDPNNHANEPDPVAHATTIAIWRCLPNYLRDLFVKAFSHVALFDPQRRPTEIEWLRALGRFRSDMLTCSCGNEVFTENAAVATCDACGKRVASRCALEVSGIKLPLVYDTRVYRFQVAVTDADEALNPVAHVLRNNHGELGIQNVSGIAWDAVTTKGASRVVPPGTVIPVKPGITFSVGETQLRILPNP